MFAFRDIGVAATVTPQCSVRVHEGESVGGYFYHMAIFCLYGIFQIPEWFLLLKECKGSCLERLASGFGMYVVKVHPTHQFIRTVAPHGLGHMVDIRVETMGVHFPSDSAALLCQLVKPLLALPQRLFCPHPVRHIPQDSYHSFRVALLVAFEVAVLFNPVEGPLLVNDPEG